MSSEVKLIKLYFQEDNVSCTRRRKVARHDVHRRARMREKLSPERIPQSFTPVPYHVQSRFPPQSSTHSPPPTAYTSRYPYPPAVAAYQYDTPYRS